MSATKVRVVGLLVLAAVVALVALVGPVAAAVLWSLTMLVAGARACWLRLGSGRLRRELDGNGWATSVDIVKHLRPSGPSTRLGRTAVGPRVPVGVRVAHEQSVGIVGGPRSGKTLALASIVRRHVGPAVVSSRRFDLLLKTVGARRRGGGPVHLFAPLGVRGATGWLLERMHRAGWLRPVAWDLVAGCEDPAAARERAAALVDATDSGSADDATWLQSASTVLRCLLRAAALGGGSMRDVYRWLTSTAEMAQAYDVLLAHDPTAAAELGSEVLSANEKGSASVMRTARLAVEFMASPDAAVTVCPEPGDEVLDVRALLEQDATLYLVSSDRKLDGLAPLMAALTSHVWDTAVRVAEEAEEGRLARTLLMALDEVKVTARVPLDDWLAVAGGYGVHLCWAAQNFAQLREKWGEHGASAIVSNSSTLLAFGGIKSVDDVHALSTLCGPDLVTPAQVRGLPKFRALALIGGCPRPTVLATPRWRVQAPALAEQVVPVLPLPGRAQIEARRAPLAIEAAKAPALPPAETESEPVVLVPDREEAA